jgi:hypothetical protein
MLTFRQVFIADLSIHTVLLFLLCLEGNVSCCLHEELSLNSLEYLVEKSVSC